MAAKFNMATKNHVTPQNSRLETLKLMLRSVALGKLEVRDRKSELPTCLHSELSTRKE